MTEPKPFDNKALADFREKHFHELENCLAASIEIRDETMLGRVEAVMDKQRELVSEYKKCEDDKARIECLQKQVNALAEILIIAEKIAVSPARERNTAIRNIASMLGALTEKSAPAQVKKQGRIDAPGVPDALQAELDALLDGISS